MYNIFDVKEGVIVHQVNCQKTMGAGIAKEIKKRFPKVYKEYLKEDQQLGNAQLVEVDKNFYVANIFGQETYGSNKRDTNYKAVRKAFKQVGNFIKANQYTLYVPFKMGCGLAKGDWRIYRDIIDEQCGDLVQICCPDLKNYKIETSYFANIKNTHNPISIARNSKLNILSLDEFKPESRLLYKYKENFINEEEYINEYKEKTLDKIDIDNLLKKLKTIADDKNRITFICYEKDVFCHRHLVAEWLRYIFGLKIKETQKRGK